MPSERPRTTTSLRPAEIDPVTEVYKRDVDRTLLRENLKLPPEERVRRLAAFIRFTEELRRAGSRLS